jgi:hypothetical protein
MPTVDWSTLVHAYGAASDIPALLAAARRAPAPRNYREEPWFRLWSSLCHQGDVYTGSYAAVPELVAIAEHRIDEPRAALECLYLAAMTELERATPYGEKVPPRIPNELAAAYAEALRRAASLAGRIRTADIEPEWRPVLTASAATFRGAYAEARSILHPPEEEDESE